MLELDLLLSQQYSQTLIINNQIAIHLEIIRDLVAKFKTSLLFLQRILVAAFAKLVKLLEY